jgi:hypothetical protein
VERLQSAKGRGLRRAAGRVRAGICMGEQTGSATERCGARGCRLGEKQPLAGGYASLISLFDSPPSVSTAYNSPATSRIRAIAFMSGRQHGALAGEYAGGLSNVK